MKVTLFKKIDYLLIFCTCILSILGVLFIYSSGINSEGVNISREYIKQLIWLGVGFAVMIGFTVFDYRRFKRYSKYLFGSICLVLVYTMLFGRTVNGAHSWIGIKGLGIQPSETAKIIYILYLARVLEETQNDKPLRRFLKVIVIMLLPMGLILGQPDLGTATVYLPIFLCMCFIAGIPSRYLGFIVGIGGTTILFTILPIWQKEIIRHRVPIVSLLTNKSLLMLVICASLLLLALSITGFLLFRKKYYYWFSYLFGILTIGLCFSIAGAHVLKPYQIQRLIVFLDPYSDPKGAGWNIIQSKIAIGAGGLWGRGFLQGTQSHYRFLPEQSTDFIFSIISEESGFVGGIIIFTCFFVILVRCIRIARNTPNQYGVFIVFGVFGMFFYHFCLNVGMVMGIMPIAGIPLPFLSYGGSAIITNMCAMGLLQSVNSRRLDFKENIL